MDEKLRNQLLAIIAEEANIDVEIDQNLYPRPEWAVGQIVRASGLVEDICRHGVGHPNLDWLTIHDNDGSLGYKYHGCDLCCMNEETKKKIRGD